MASVSAATGGILANGISWLHVYIAGAALLVCALVASVLLFSLQKTKRDDNNGLIVFLKFVYASFLKPHDKSGEGQQHALESFYKTQVGLSESVILVMRALILTCCSGRSLRC